ncbi:MFS general substrate transporter [Armillaria novae-zelandiae]|uniref:MFS general substrate transporter n=1 Tax=Armillaria novae-zelandiae TaxID=153914 RepID=A0AA39PTA5_9AGAR|nr:MFS general substrate transporter [Armillaria novae-zelandiae]
MTSTHLCTLPADTTDSESMVSSIVSQKAGSFDNNSESLYNAHIDVSGVDERKLLRKLDIALVPWLSFLYLLSFLDRSSIAKWLYHFEEDLHISDNQYHVALTIFFFSYSFFEVPSNILLKRLSPFHLAINSHPSLGCNYGKRATEMGLLMLKVYQTVQGLVHNYGSLLGNYHLSVYGWLLGTFEAGLFPGISYYLSCWYKRSEFGVRAAVFFSAATVSGAFGGLLAVNDRPAISNMEGVGGKHAWAWIFILEGLVTVIAGVASFWLIQDFPDTAKFLSEKERTVVVRRLQGDNQFSANGEEFQVKYIKQSFCDWKTWIGAGVAMPMHAFSLFLPSIIHQASYKATKANLLAVPVYALACIVTCIVGFSADRCGRRGYFNLNATLSYFAVYLAACGVFPIIRDAWLSNNVEGAYKRGVTLAMVISIGNLNGAISANVYRADNMPWYPLGLVLLYLGIGAVFSTVYLILLKRENKKRERGERDEVIGDSTVEKVPEENGRFATVSEAKMEKGDNWSGYRYTL